MAASSNFGNPRRMATGVDLSRVLMLLAVMEKRLGMHISAHDIYVNVVGGLKMIEPAADLGILLSVASSFRNKPLDSGLVAIGEVGLAGELRSCNFLENRIAEAEKLGFTKCLIPAANGKRIKKFDKIEVCTCSNIRQVLEEVFS